MTVKSRLWAVWLCIVMASLGWPIQTRAAGLTARPIEVFMHTWMPGFEPLPSMTVEEQLIATLVDQITQGRFIEARHTMEELERKSASSNDAILLAGLRRLAAIQQITLFGGGSDTTIDYPPDLAVNVASLRAAGNCHTDEIACLRYFLQLAEVPLDSILPDTPQSTDSQPFVEELQSAVRNRWIEAVDASRLQAAVEVGRKSLTIAESIDAVQAKCSRLTRALGDVNSRAFLVSLNLACGNLLAAPFGPVATLGITLGREPRVATGARKLPEIDGARLQAAASFYEKAETLAQESGNPKMLMASGLAKAYLNLHRNSVPPIKELVSLANQAEATGSVENAAVLYGVIGALAASNHDLTYSLSLVTANESWGGLATVIDLVQSMSSYGITPAVSLENLLSDLSALKGRWQQALPMRIANLESSLSRIYGNQGRLEPAITAAKRAIAMRENIMAATPSRFPNDHWIYYIQSDDLLLLAAQLQQYNGEADTRFESSVRNEIKTELESVAAHMTKPPDISSLQLRWKVFDNGVAIYDAYINSNSCSDFTSRYAPLRRELVTLTGINIVLGIDALEFYCDESVRARDVAELDGNDPMPRIEQFIRRARSGKQVDAVQPQNEYELAWTVFPNFIAEATIFEDSTILLHWANRIQDLVNTLHWPQGLWLVRYLRAIAWNIDGKYSQALEAVQLIASDPDSDPGFSVGVRQERIKALAGLKRAEESLLEEEQTYESGWRNSVRRTGLDFATVGVSAELARLDRLAVDQALSPREEARRLELVNVIARQQPSDDPLPSAEDIRKAIGALDEGAIVLRYGEVGRFLYLWRITKGNVTITQLPQTYELISRSCAQLSRLLREHLDGWEGLASDLYATLIPAGSLTAGARVIVIGSDLLSNIPFEVLGPIRGPTLLASNTVTYSRRLLGKSKYESMAFVSPSQALIVGLNSGGLTHAEEEAEEIAAMLKSELVIGNDVSKQRVAAALPGKRWVHFATHGTLFPNNLYSSYLSLYGGDRLELWELLAYTHGGVMILSACDTFRGVSTPSSRQQFGSIGQLSLVAGAPWVIANLWQADDAISEQIMTTFYRNIRSGSVDLPHALQAAKRKAASTYQDPFYYASFVSWSDGVPTTQSDRPN